MALGSALLVAGCNDKDRRMGEREALDYRRQLVREQADQLSPEQRWRLMHHPGRTQREIDQTLDRYRSEFREQQIRDAASWESSRRSAVRGVERLPEGTPILDDGPSGGGGDDPRGRIEVLDLGDGDVIGSGAGGAEEEGED